MNQTPSREPIPGAGIDRDNRPGVPMETAHKPASGAHWTEPERQEATTLVLKTKNLDGLTPVFSNALPPRGLSGLIRRAAYRVPEHKTAHWLLLLLGDRVDVLEHRLMRVLRTTVPLAAGALLLASPARRTLRRRRSFLRRVFA